MHALAGLAGSAAARTQTVIDVLCAYLRQPFHHPGWDRPPAVAVGADHAAAAAPDVTKAENGQADEDADREREVRRTALRLITSLLPDLATVRAETPALQVDLTAAELDDVHLRRKALSLQAAQAQFHGDAGFDGAQFRGTAEFGETQFRGTAEFGEAQFHEGAPFILDGASFDADLFLPVDAPLTSAAGTTVDARRNVGLPRGWALRAPFHPKSALVPPEAGEAS